MMSAISLATRRAVVHTIRKRSVDTLSFRLCLKYSFRICPFVVVVIVMTELRSLLLIKLERFCVFKVVV